MYFNLFVPNAPFLYPLKIFRELRKVAFGTNGLKKQQIFIIALNSSLWPTVIQQKWILHLMASLKLLKDLIKQTKWAYQNYEVDLSTDKFGSLENLILQI